MAQDIWNLFDGICISPGGIVTFLQMKTNAWADARKFKKFVSDTIGVKIISFNVSNKLKESNGKYVVYERVFG